MTKNTRLRSEHKQRVYLYERARATATRRRCAETASGKLEELKTGVLNAAEHTKASIQETYEKLEEVSQPASATGKLRNTSHGKLEKLETWLAQAGWAVIHSVSETAGMVYSY
jgi:hypothetical protein